MGRKKLGVLREKLILILAIAVLVNLTQKEKLLHLWVLDLRQMALGGLPEKLTAVQTQ